MKQRQAITIAIQAIEEQIKRLAVEANLHDVYKLDAPHCVAASKRRAQLREAIEALRGERQTAFI